jgi:hypothetical protein
MNSRTLLLLLLIGCVLPFGLKATNSHAANKLPHLYHQLASVNKQWFKIAPSAALNAPAKQFTSDTRLIQEHLEYTEQYLRSKNVSGLTSSQLQNRLHSLDVLHAYGLRGQFPQNHDFPVRIPYFIDAHGTACAVGYLIIESGHTDLAEMIQARGNNDYLLDMNYPELTAWVAQSGFTANELALIQPGYLPSTTWSTYGTGTNGYVQAITTSDDGTKMYVGGHFSEIDGTPVRNIAYWDGTSWHALGDSLFGTVYDIAEYHGSLYAGGVFTSANGALSLDPIRKWNGTTWEDVGSFWAPIGEVYTLQVYKDKLFLGGEFQLQTGALRENLAWIDDTLLTSGTDEPDAAVRALYVYNDKLIVAGRFSNVGSITVDNIAAYDDTVWTALGAGVHTTVVRALEEMDGKLYIGGDFAQTSTDTLMAYGYWNGSTWTDLSHLMGTYDIQDTTQTPLPYSISDLQADSGQMYIAGAVSTTPMQMYSGYGLLAGNDNNISGYGQLNSAANVLEVYNGDLIAGGTFDTVRSVSSVLTNVGGIIYTDKNISSVINYDKDIMATVYPNPFFSQAILKVKGAEHLQRPVLVIYELSGKTVRMLNCDDDGTTSIEKGDLSAGLYLYQLQDNNGVKARGRIVIQ